MMEIPSIEDMAAAYCNDRLIVVKQLRNQAIELELKAVAIRKQADDLENLVKECQAKLKKDE